MIHRIAESMTQRAIHINACNESDQEIVIYYIENLINKFINYSLLLVFGIVLNAPLQMIAYATFLTILRGQTGGHHASTHIGCSIETSLVSIVATIISINTNSCIIYLTLAALLLSVVYIRKHAPIRHLNLRLTDFEIRSLNVYAKRVITVELLFIVLLFVNMATVQIAISASLAIVTAAISMKLAKLMNQEEE